MTLNKRPNTTAKSRKILQKKGSPQTGLTEPIISRDQSQAVD